MNILAVDDEKIALELLVDAINEYDSTADVFAFCNPKDAIAKAAEQQFDVAFLDLQMYEMTGLELASKLREIQPDVHVIFTTGFSEYAVDAYDMHAEGYVLKPITPEKIEKEISALFKLKPLVKEKAVRICCFGNFEIFIHGEPINFKYGKTKQLLAYLIDRRGTSCQSKEISAILWEEGQHESYLRNIRKDLLDTLEKFGCRDIILNDRGKISIVMNQVECDYYNWLKDHNSVLYQGEYMAQYSWAENTNAWIQQVVEKQ